MIIIIRLVQAGHGDVLDRMERTEADNERVSMSYLYDVNKLTNEGR